MNLVIWEMLGFSHQFSIAWENATKPIAWGEPGKLVVILFPQYGQFFPIRFPSYGILHHLEMHGFSHQFPIVRENATKPIAWGKPGKLVIILFPQYGYFFPIRFSFYDILHHMGNVWVFPSISHSTGKCNKTHRMGKAWEIGNHAFPIVSVLFPI